jgi:hypothetical protein
VRAAAAALRAALAASPVPGLALAGGASAGGSPVLHLHLRPGTEARLGRRPGGPAGALQEISDILLQRHGVFVALPRYSVLDEVRPRPSIKLVVNAALAAEGRVELVAAALREAAGEVLGDAA